MSPKQEFSDTEVTNQVANTSHTTSPWTEWSSVFADPNSTVNLPAEPTQGVNGKSAKPHKNGGSESDGALMDCYNG